MPSAPSTRPIRVAHVGTGNVGRPALRHVIEDERFELTGVWVSNPDKYGKDAGELCGNGVDTGIKATGDWDELLAGDAGGKPDVVLYCAMGDTRLFEAFADAKRVLEAGCHFIGTSPGTLLYPLGTVPDDWWQPLDETARANNVSIFVNGVDPGFVGDLLPLSLASTCREITHIRWCEIADYASYDGAEVLFDLMGFGSTEDQVPMLYQPGILGYAWGTAIRQLATGLGVELDAITDSCERSYAEEGYDIAAGRIEKGGLEAVRFFIHGVVNGQEVITVEHVTRLRPDVRPEWRQPAGEGGSYRIEITGEPSYAVDVVLSSKDGDHNYSPILAGAGRVVNAIPDVIAAGPGLRSTIDLPLPTSRGVFKLPS